MKKFSLFIILVFGVLTTYSSFAMKKDTTIIEFEDKSIQKRVTVLSPDSKKIYIPKSLNLSKLLTEIGVDSTERDKALIILGGSKSNNDTLLVLSKEGNRIKIITKENLFNKKDTLVDPQSHPEDTYPNTTEKPIEDYKPSFDDPIKVEKPKVSKFFKKSDFGFYVGLNNFTNAPEPVSPSKEYGLNTIGSRFFALSFRKNATLVSGKNMDLALSIGPEFAWNNFRFEENVTAKYIDNQVEFSDSDLNLKKSKLVLPYINVPAMLNFGFKESKFKIGLGGFIGYRLGGYTKTKNTSNDKHKEQATYGMNDFHYGLTAEIGKRKGITFFGRYHMNNLFKDNQINGANLQPFSFGIRI